MAEATAETVTPEAPKQKHKPSKPPKTTKMGKPDPVPKLMTFFERLAGIPKEDWGARAKVKVYRLEPVIDHLRGSYVKYISVYVEPIDEERIKQDQGSGRYRLHLNFKAPAAEEKELDSIEFDILDQNFPPRIPKGEWVDNPINAKWAWAKKYYDAQNPPEPAPATPSGTFVEAARAVNEIQENALKRVPQAAAGTDGVTILEAVRLGLDMAKPEKATEDSTLKAIMDLNREMMISAREEAKELRSELRAMREKPQAAQVNPLDMIATTIEKLTPVVERLFPQIKKAGEEVVEKAVRSRMGSWQEFFSPVLPGVIELLKPAVGAIAQGMLMNSQSSPAAANNGAKPTGSTGTGATTAPGSTVADLLNFITPVMIGYVRDESDGGAFADWLAAGWGREQLDRVRAASIDQMISFLQTKHWWNNKGKNGTEQSLAEMQPQLRTFLEEFMAWTGEEEATEESETEMPVIDLTAEPAEAMI